MRIERLDFLLELTRRRIVERYVGASHILFWIVVSPLVPVVTNLLIFYFVARMPQVRDMGLATYGLFLLSGLLPYRILQRALSEAGDLLTASMELLRSTAFPVPYLSLVSTLGMAVEFAIQLALLVVLVVWWRGAPGPALLLLPVAFVLLFALMVGLSWTFSVLGHFVREVNEITSITMVGLLYLTPAVYPVDAVPASLQSLILLNPLSHVVIAFRDALLSAPEMHWQSWAIFAALAAAALAAGAALVSAVRGYVGDMV